MNQITKSAVSAFLSGKTFRSGNTSVIVDGEDTIMELHGNPIAIRNNVGLYIDACGWKTKTTKERLNGLPEVFISQKKGEWYLNGERWDGKQILVS